MEVNVVGTAYEHLAQALTGGSILMLGIGKGNNHLTLRVDGETEPVTPERFLRIIPTGSVEG